MKININYGDGWMKIYTVILIQLIIWSGFTFIEWLSKYDQLFFKVMMFFIFFYLALIIGNYIVKSIRKTFYITTLSLGLYGSIQFTMSVLN